jgi:hypothetical protein
MEKVKTISNMLYIIIDSTGSPYGICNMKFALINNENITHRIIQIFPFFTNEIDGDAIINANAAAHITE